MILIKGLFFLLLLTCVFLFGTSYAQDIKYSLGPKCKEKRVVCSNPNEMPVCIVLNPRVHIERVSGKKINRYQPSCIGYKDNIQPVCVDIDSAGYKIAEGVVIECIENVQCQKDTLKNKLSAFCPSGKTPKCLGSENSPNCEADPLCDGNSVPVCDYVWQAKKFRNSSLQGDSERVDAAIQ